jgi:transposase
MDKLITIGLDIAKQVFQVHGVDAAGQIIVRRRLKRADVLKFFSNRAPCLVGIEACGTSHHWARQIAAAGHEVRLLQPIQVKAYVKPGKKNDATDAEAICEAVSRPRLRAVPIKSEAQQSMVILHRTRDLLVRQRTMLINALRSHMAEFGVVSGQGRGNFVKLLATLNEAEGKVIPHVAREALREIAGQISDADDRIAALEKEIVTQHRLCETSRNLASIPGIGPIIATAIAAAVPDPSVFKTGRDFAAWLGLVPRQNSTGGKTCLGPITKTGDRYIRRLLVIGATGLIRYKRENVPGGLEWVTKLLAKKPIRLVTVALANKMARIAWAVLSSGELYREAPSVQHA